MIKKALRLATQLENAAKMIRELTEHIEDFEPSKSALLIQDVGVLGIDDRAHNALRGSRIFTIDQLIERSSQDLLKCRGLGRRSLWNITNKLKKSGLELADGQYGSRENWFNHSKMEG